jgi:hypothetical protein
MRSLRTSLLNLCASVLTLGFVAPGPGQERQPPPDAPALPPAHKVTLVGDKMPLSEALKKLHEQGGVVVEDKRGDDDPALSLNLKDVPFWQAVDAVTDAAGAQLLFYPRNMRVALEPRPAKAAPQPVSYAGPYRIALKRVTNFHDFETDTTACVGALEVSWEPQALPLLLERTQPKVTARAGKEERTLPAEGSSWANAAVDGRFTTTLDVRFPAMPRDAKKFDRVEGAVQVIAPTRMAHLDLGPLAKPKVMDTNADITCRVNEVKLDADRWQVKITVDTPRGSSELLSTDQIGGAWILNNQLALVSADGKKRLLPTTWVLGNDPVNKALITYHFTGAGRGNAADWTITYRTPSELKKMSVPFVFKDVKLP